MSFVDFTTKARCMNDASGKSFSSSTYSPTILHGFHQLRDSHALCDVTLCADGASFNVHKALLASASDYFRGKLLFMQCNFHCHSYGCCVYIYLLSCYPKSIQTFWTMHYPLLKIVS